MTGCDRTKESRQLLSRTAPLQARRVIGLQIYTPSAAIVLTACHVVSPVVPAEFAIEFDQLAEWISDVKKIFNEELFEGGKKK